MSQWYARRKKLDHGVETWEGNRGEHGGCGWILGFELGGIVRVLVLNTCYLVLENQCFADVLRAMVGLCASAWKQGIDQDSFLQLFCLSQS